MKKFFEWIKLKAKIDGKNTKPPMIFEREIWWASLGDNVGQEINGKSNDFTRPVIIYKKLSHKFYLVIPTTTKIKNGSWFVIFNNKCRVNVACLHQVKSMDYRRLRTRMGKLPKCEYQKLRERFKALYD